MAVTYEFSLRLDADVAEISRTAEAVDMHGEEAGWPAGWVFNFNLALDEIITNIINNAYSDDGEHVIHLFLKTREGEVAEVIVEDDGVAFDPFHEAPEPVLTGDLESRPIGGLGVHLVKNLMHEVDYVRVDGRNRVTLRMRWPE